MLITIPNILDQQRLDFVKQTLEKANFVDGTLSAGMAAKRVKNNEELSIDDTQMQQLNNIVMGSLIQHDEFKAAAIPLRVAAPYYARYNKGMTYGDHVDDPIMGNAGQQYRSDVSTTVFLNEPNEYEGGELVIRTSFGEQKIKLSAGSAVVYPSSSLHHVAEVTKGTRLVAVTWSQSMIRDPAKRELLYQLNQARESLLKTRPDDVETKQIDVSYVNLFRMWSEL
ncbi:MAG: Fe2+-dependent dioxygenase [Gammaproteobacteria bacterium]|nr:Fe2+-dependent dioxygenase [Gammaproteobacteria bacterium]MCW8986067.1 Fe2+-dependent dioxygenase [Gammaproteobacteria bacterium]MCW9032328.1 Fe2+-dependent dioxygenase [Gammaproteobacteria bacterium]